MTIEPFVLVHSPNMRAMANSISDHLRDMGAEFSVLEVDVQQFANGELLPHLTETVRRQHVFFLHGFDPAEPHADIWTLFLVNDMLNLASVRSISLVLPYMPYLRQDRKDKPRVPISARTFADHVQVNRLVQRIITMDLHTDQEQGFYRIPVDNLTAQPLFVEYFTELLGTTMEDVVVVAPDSGDAKRARSLAKKLGNVPVAIFEKDRPGANQSVVLGVIGASVAGKRVVMYDDIIDTGGTIAGVMDSLMELGATEVHVCATHGIFSGEAVSRFSKLGFGVRATNSLPRSPEYLRKNPWLGVVPIDGILAEVILEAATIGGSISKISSR